MSIWRCDVATWRNSYTLALVACVSGMAGVGLGWLIHKHHVQEMVVREEDRNHDGKTDRWTELDARGRTARVREDLDYDGFAERTEIYVDGRINRVDYDSNHDRSYDHTDQLGADGRVVSVMTDNNWNTIPERWVQLNAHGAVASEWIDADENSVVEHFRAYDTGNRLTEEGIDANSDGFFEISRTFNTRWPPTAGPLRIEHDDDRDGIYERRESLTREGRIRSINEDTDHDGVREHIALFRPDGTLHKEGYDRDGDGFFESWRFPVVGAPARQGYDDNEDYDIDRWDPPGAPAGWCDERCSVRTVPPSVR
jgi:hypothetical protein